MKIATLQSLFETVFWHMVSFHLVANTEAMITISKIWLALSNVVWHNLSHYNNPLSIPLSPFLSQPWSRTAPTIPKLSTSVIGINKVNHKPQKNTHTRTQKSPREVTFSLHVQKCNKVSFFHLTHKLTGKSLKPNPWSACSRACSHSPITLASRESICPLTSG